MTILSIARAYPLIVAFLLVSQAVVNPNYDEMVAEEEALLVQELLESSFIDNATWEKEDSLVGAMREYMLQPYPYITIEPSPDQYVIRILVEPCLGQSTDCCNSTYGTPEFPVYPDRDSSESRVVPKLVHAPLDRRLEGLVLLWEDQTEVVRSYSRFSDDEMEVNDTCLEKGVPDEGCINFRRRRIRSSLPLRCTDNNRTVSGTSHCKDVQGNTNGPCMTVGYTQTALIPVCGDGGGDVAADFKCGTFLEVHIAQGNRYVEMEHIISSTHIKTPNVTGYVTTQVPITWMLNSSRVLCAYNHVNKLVGTQVLITSLAPACCFPRAYSQSDMLGSFFCPRIGNAQGPWAATLETISDLLAQDTQLSEPPFCPEMKHTDGLFISKYDEGWSRRYTRPALPVEQDPSTLLYTSDDLDGSYESQCPYVPGGGIKNDGSTTCGGQDMLFTFTGHVGKITSVPDRDAYEDQYGVTFNGGRTTYMFSEEEIKVEYDEHNYELWWVQRAQGRSIVKKMKNFAVQSPPCTFDTIHGEYFPYAKLDVLGNPID